MVPTALQVFQAFRASMLAKNDNWKDLLADDVRLTGPLADVAGKAAFIEVNAPFFASIQTSELIEKVEVSNYVITQITTTVLTPTNETLTLHVSEWYHIHEGLIQSLRVYFDTADFRKAMGF